MREHLTAQTFFNTIALARQASPSLILVVEGDDDHFILNDHINSDDVLLIAGIGGRPAILAAAQMVDDHTIGGVRFLVDAEYDAYLVEQVSYPSAVVLASNHDIAMDVVLTSVRHLDRVINAHSRSARRSGATLGTADARTSAVGLARSVGFLRVLNERRQLGLRLRDFPFGSLRSHTPSSQELVNAAASRSSSAVDTANVTAELEMLRLDLGTDDIRIVGDHDFFGALAFILRRHGVSVSKEMLWASFLSSVDCTSITETDWYPHLRDWGEKNERTTFTCQLVA